MSGTTRGVPAYLMAGTNIGISAFETTRKGVKNNDFPDSLGAPVFPSHDHRPAQSRRVGNIHCELAFWLDSHRLVYRVDLGLLGGEIHSCQDGSRERRAIL